MNILFLSMSLSFFSALIFTPFLLKILNKMNAKQSILHYVQAHKSKEGTPTLGGLIFIFGIIFSSFFLFTNNNQLALISLMVMLGYGLLGFLDDFLKIKYKHNLGLRAYQKALGQLGIAIIISIYAYSSNFVGSEIYIPFLNTYLDLGFWIIPFTIFVFIAVTNSVNLTDGLDGLAGWTSLVFFISFGIFLYLYVQNQINNGLSLLMQNEYQNLLVLIFATIGGLLAFLIFNSHPAKIFMGDTGSLAIGGLISVITLFTQSMLLIPLLYTVILISSISVIIQVFHFKRTKRRVFLMAPYHHHLEKKGLNENKIVAIYIITTIIINALVFAFIL